MSTADTDVTGLTASKLGELMRDPVTITSVSVLSGAAVVVVDAVVCDIATGATLLAAAAAMAARIANCNLR
jgi:hypoxanthine phosphoribosyltransferase